MARPRTGCWRCDGDPCPVPLDFVDWLLVALHDVLGHDKAAAFLGVEPDPRPVVTGAPRAEYL